MKEVISEDGIHEFLVKLSMEFSHYTTFVHKFVVDMEKIKEFNLTLDVKKEHIFNSWECYHLNFAALAREALQFWLRGQID